MLKKFLFAAVVLFGALTAKEVLASQTYSEATITPNKLTVEREDGKAAKTTIDTFRIRGYNVAQLRSLVQACGGSVISDEYGYQIVTEPRNIPYAPIAFPGVATVKVQFNITRISDKTGKFIYPGEPGWVFLTDYNYNWGSIRDVLAAMGYEIKRFSDDPGNARTSVVIGEIKKTEPGMKEFPTPSGYAGACPVYVYSEHDLNMCVSENYNLIKVKDPDMNGENVWIHARDGVKEVRIYRVGYTDNNGNFTFTVSKQLYAAPLKANSILVLSTVLPEGVPHTALTFIGNDGKAYSYLLQADGRIGVDIAAKIDLRGIQ
ncbi:MAG: hypothetical protein LBB94_04355 [Clostridiales bacterium]|jgi:hypothetical protein|nr:hypothetical protein [Clostridiales bacterium]